LEAGPIMHLVNDMLVESLQRVALIIVQSRRSGVSLVVIRHDNDLLGWKISSSLSGERNLVEVFLWFKYFVHVMLKGIFVCDVIGMLFNYCYNLKGIRFLKVIDVGVSCIYGNKMFLVTESERKIRAYGFLSTEDEGVSLSEQWEFIDKKIIPHEVHCGEGVRRRSNFVSAVSEDILEAGADIHQKECKLTKMVIMVIDNPRKVKVFLIRFIIIVF
jgi:hypothetical protein